MKKNPMNRRRFLTQAGTVLSLPLLESMFPFSSAWAQAVGNPKRYVLVYFPNGTYNYASDPLWVTRPGAISAANTTPIFEPFPAIYPDLIVATNVNQARKRVTFDDHCEGSGFYLTGKNNGENAGTSFDQRLAALQGKPAWVLSGGNLGYDSGSFPGRDTTRDQWISYQNGKGIFGVSNPGDLARTLLKQVVVRDPANTVPSSTKSVLDSIVADIKTLIASEGKSGAEKLDEYFTNIRALEKIQDGGTPSTPPGTSACQNPTLDPNLDTNDVRNDRFYIPRFFAMNDMIKIAFACDLTRTVTIMVDNETPNRTVSSVPNNLIYNGADIAGMGFHNGISHAQNNRRNLCATRDRFLFQIVADLMSKLKSGRDPSGSSMLDNTFIQSGHGFFDGNHTADAKLPLIFAGGRNFMTTGRTLDLGSYDLLDVYYNISRLMGVNMPDFEGYKKVIAGL